VAWRGVGHEIIDSHRAGAIAGPSLSDVIYLLCWPLSCVTLCPSSSNSIAARASIADDLSAIRQRDVRKLIIMHISVNEA